MSILDKVKDVADQAMKKEKEVETEIIEKAEESIEQVTNLAASNKDFAKDLLTHINLPDVNVNDAIDKMFGEGKSKEFIAEIQKQVTKFLMKNPKVLKEVIKLTAKFSK